MELHDREQLESWVRAKTTPQRVAFRAQICLMAADGISATDIADKMNTTRPTVLLWKKRFEEQGPEGLTKDAPRGPSPRRLDEETRQAVIDATLNSSPPDGTQWTTRNLAKTLGISNATVARLWKTLGITPKKKKSAKRSKPKPQEQRNSELVGVYLNPFIKVLVLNVAPSGANHLQHDGFALPECRDDDCDRCISGAISLLDQAEWMASRSFTNGVYRFFEQFGTGGAMDSVHVFLECVDNDTDNALKGFLPGMGISNVHSFPWGFFQSHGIGEQVAMVTGTRPMLLNGAAQLLSAIKDHVKYGNGTPKPFVWARSILPGVENRQKCKTVLEMVSGLGSILSQIMYSTPRNQNDSSRTTEEPMSWKQKLESWFAAIAFAEEGEHKTALEVSSTVIPDYREVTSSVGALSKIFSAAAFAEENCHDQAAEIMYGSQRKQSFLDAVGLTNVRAWYGTAALESSFAEAVGLGGVKFKLITIPL